MHLSISPNHTHYYRVHTLIGLLHRQHRPEVQSRRTLRGHSHNVTALFNSIGTRTVLHGQDSSTVLPRGWITDVRARQVIRACVACFHFKFKAWAALYTVMRSVLAELTETAASHTGIYKKVGVILTYTKHRNTIVRTSERGCTWPLCSDPPFSWLSFTGPAS